jgi:hypothetical protein
MKMLRRLSVARAAACALALTTLALPALAQTTPASPTSIDFRPIVNDVVMPAVVSLLGILAAWLGMKLRTWLGLQQNSALAGTLETALQNALAFAQSKVQGVIATAPLTLDVKNQVIAEAANYALAHVPDTLKALGVDQKLLIQKLEARLSLNTTPTAESIAVPADPAAVRPAG